MSDHYQFSVQKISSLWLSDLSVFSKVVLTMRGIWKIKCLSLSFLPVFNEWEESGQNRKILKLKFVRRIKTGKIPPPITSQIRTSQWQGHPDLAQGWVLEISNWIFNRPKLLPRTWLLYSLVCFTSPIRCQNTIFFFKHNFRLNLLLPPGYQTASPIVIQQIQ